MATKLKQQPKSDGRAAVAMARTATQPATIKLKAEHTAGLFDAPAVVTPDAYVEKSAAAVQELVRLAGTTAPTVPAWLVSAVVELNVVKSVLEGQIKVAKSACEAVANSKGSFETGSNGARISVDVTNGRSVAWKDEAIALAARLAKLENRPFNEELFIADVQSRNPLSTKTTVKLVEG